MYVYISGIFKYACMYVYMQNETLPEDLPNKTLKPNRHEKKCQWWIDSCRYFDEQLVEERPRKKARNSQTVEDEPEHPTPPHHDDQATFDSMGTGRREPSQPSSQPGSVDSVREEVHSLREEVHSLVKRVDEQQQIINRLLEMVESREV